MRPARWLWHRNWRGRRYIVGGESNGFRLQSNPERRSYSHFRRSYIKRRPENENLLMGAIAELTKNKTVIMIAHRLKTVRNADQIFVLSGGHIVQTGKHEDLIRQPGIYADFIGIRKKAIGWKLK